MSTARFLPTVEEELADFHWAISAGSRDPPGAQRRSLWIHVSELVGRSLVHAKTPWDLFVALGHAMLGVCWSLLRMSRRLTCHQDG